MRQFLAVLLLSLVALGVDSAVAQTASDKKSDGDFTGLIFITDDPVWHEQFERPETPSISGRDHLAAGERGALAIIFSNAEPSNGVVKVVCTVTAFDPTGSQVIVDAGPCYEGPYAGPNILHPALLDLQFEIGPDDPEGKAGFEVLLHDVNSGREVRLAVAFMQGGQSS